MSGMKQNKSIGITDEDFIGCEQLPSWRNIYIFGPAHGDFSVDYIGPSEKPDYVPEQSIEELLNEPIDGTVIPEKFRENRKDVL